MSKVLCPYCGSEMKLEESLPFSGVYAYVCECGAVSPSECGKEEAYAAAIRRPLQKPLTAKQAVECREPCIYLELIDDPSIYAANFQLWHAKGVYIASLFGSTITCNPSDYGKDLRCWATKPSEEERSAARWEEL